MNDSSFRSARESGHDVRSGCLAACLPLLQLNDNDIVVVLFVNSCNQEINPFGCQRNLIFNRHLALVINLRNIDGIPQILQRVRPTAIFCLIMMVEVVGGKFILDDGSYGIASDIIDKTAFGVAIDYHGFSICPLRENLACVSKYRKNPEIIPKLIHSPYEMISVQPGAWHIRLSGAARLASPRMTISFRQHGVIARLPVIGRRLPDKAFEEFSEI